MGFGSYDESEQENQAIDTEDLEDDGVETEQNAHNGQVDFEFDESNDELINRLDSIKEQ